MVRQAHLTCLEDVSLNCACNRETENQCIKRKARAQALSAVTSERKFITADNGRSARPAPE